MAASGGVFRAEGSADEDEHFGSENHKLCVEGIVTNEINQL